jgi:aspartate racemase
MTGTIGILGGMGPRATVHFEQLLLDTLSGTDQQLPTILSINDGSIPDRSSFLIGQGADPVPRLKKNIRFLEKAGASIVCMPCNTACAPAIFNRLQNDTKLHIINLPDEVGLTLDTLKLQNVFILATEGTIDAGVFQRQCQIRGIAYTTPNPEIQQMVSATIAAVKENKLELARLYARRIKVQVARNKCDGLILGCTELPIVKADLAPPGCVALDTLEILAKAAAYYTKGDTRETKGDAS